jgi:hypothetical protein
MAKTMHRLSALKCKSFRPRGSMPTVTGCISALREAAPRVGYIDSNVTDTATTWGLAL